MITCTNHLHTQTFGFYLSPGFSLPAYTILAEVFRIVNDEVRQPLFEWYSIGPDENLIQSASGLWVKPDKTINQVKRLDKLVVISALENHLKTPRKVINWLRQLAGQGSDMGAISSGVWLLARSGLLDGYRCTVHWHEQDAFAEAYPHLNRQNTLYEIDRRRFTCAGGTAALDMIIEMIAMLCQPATIAAVKRRLFQEIPRQGSELQRTEVSLANSTVQTAVKIMLNQLENTLSVDEIARRCEVSDRQLNRLFHRHIGQTPKGYYLNLRLDRAASLLKHSKLSITEIAFASGFESLTRFSLAFKQREQLSPRKYRAYISA